MSTSYIISQLLEHAALPAEPGRPHDGGLIGLFQAFRPHGLPQPEMFERTRGGTQFVRRMQLLYDAIAGSRRLDGLQDAYFVVRHPPMLHAERAEALAHDFLLGVAQIAAASEKSVIREQFEPLPQIRILEGKPPKHPRSKQEQAKLLQCLKHDIPNLIQSSFPTGSLGDELSEALYFTACDALLRDFLRWPLLESERFGQDPLQAYFQLWRHGVKYRVFRNDQVDFYLPWRSTGHPVDAGQFAGQG